MGQRLMGNLPANIRVNAAFPFPSLVQGSGPITVAKNNGIWTIGSTEVGGGNVSNDTVPAAPTSGQIAAWTDATHIQGLATAASPSTMFLRGDNTWQVPAGGGGGATQLFDTAHGANSAAAANIPPIANFVVTAGYGVVGDGGGATYARFNLTNYPDNIFYSTYGFTSADGARWQYIPEPTGWNALAAGVVADGVTDDSAHVMDALLPFQGSAIIVNGGDLTGRLFLPAAPMALFSSIYITGSVGASVEIIGQSAFNLGGVVSTCFVWKGSSGQPTMVFVYGANQISIEGVNFVGSTGSGLVNNIHVTADNPIINFGNVVITGGPYAPGVNTFGINTPQSMLTAGGNIAIGIGTPNFEIVYITGATASTFTARSFKTHNAGERLGSSALTNNIKFARSTHSIALPYVDGFSCGILIGNPMNGASAQAAQLVIDQCQLAGAIESRGITISIANPAVISDAGHKLINGTAVQWGDGADVLPLAFSKNLTYYVVNAIAGVSYQLSLTQGGAAISTLGGTQSGTHILLVKSFCGLRSNSGGNVKNYYINNSVFTHTQIGLGQAFSGSMEIFYPTFAGMLRACIEANGTLNLNVTSAEDESSGNYFLLGGGGGLNAQGATLIQNSYQSGLPWDGYVISYNGNLTLIGNSFFNTTPSGSQMFQVIPRVGVGSISVAAPVTTLVPGAVCSIGNYYMFAGPNLPTLYDLNGNSPLDFSDPFSGAAWRVLQLNDYGDNGRIINKIGAVSFTSAGLATYLTTPGITFNNFGEPGAFTQSYTIPFAQFQNASTGKQFTLCTIPPRITIMSAFIDVTTAFSNSLGGSLSLELGTNNVGVNNLVLASDATVIAYYGTNNVELGVSLRDPGLPGGAGGTRQASLGYASAGAWASGGETIVLRMNGANNLSGLTAGSVTVYLSYIKSR
jgi:hypothetical protein